MTQVGLPYERGGGDTRRLTWGCKFQILVSLRVFWAKRLLYLVLKVSFRSELHMKKYKKIIYFQFILFTWFM